MQYLNLLRWIVNLLSHHCFNRRSELSLFEECILWGTRVVVPSVCREAILTELHEGYPGMAWMKGLTRMYICVVARNHVQYRDHRLSVYRMPDVSVETSLCTITTIELAHTSMDSIAPGLRWSSKW